eukprot:5145700-Karenia_brevis.AAC.1
MRCETCSLTAPTKCTFGLCAACCRNHQGAHGVECKYNKHAEYNKKRHGGRGRQEGWSSHPIMSPPETAQQEGSMSWAAGARLYDMKMADAICQWTRDACASRGKHQRGPPHDNAA